MLERERNIETERHKTCSSVSNLSVAAKLLNLVLVSTKFLLLILDARRERERERERKKTIFVNSCMERERAEEMETHNLIEFLRERETERGRRY